MAHSWMHIVFKMFTLIYLQSIVKEVSPITFFLLKRRVPDSELLSPKVLNTKINWPDPESKMGEGMWPHVQHICLGSSVLLFGQKVYVISRIDMFHMTKNQINQITSMFEVHYSL